MLDLDKPITTRRGAPVRVICRDSRSKTGPLAVLITTPTGNEELRSYARDGRCHPSQSDRFDSGSDLINVRTKVKRWVVTYLPGTYAKPWRAYETSAAAIKENTDECGILSVVQAIEFKDVYEDEL